MADIERLGSESSLAAAGLEEAPGLGFESSLAAAMMQPVQPHTAASGNSWELEALGTAVGTAEGAAAVEAAVVGALVAAALAERAEDAGAAVVAAVVAAGFVPELPPPAIHGFSSIHLRDSWP